jgi:hypothetical protein
MTKSQRQANLFPSDEPKYVRCYDNGGKTADRYTVVYTGNYRNRTGHGLWGTSNFEKGWFQHVCMSSSPFHPQGVGMHGEHSQQIDVNKAGWAPAMGRSNHLGKRIPFRELPADCQKLVVSDYKSIWGLDTLDIS